MNGSASYNPWDEARPTQQPTIPTTVPERFQHGLNLPTICVGSMCHIGRVTGTGCSERCKLTAQGPDPILPKPPQ
jgi:hypothetical protein